MKLTSTDKKNNTILNRVNLCAYDESFEVAVVEDNKLVNRVLSNELDATIARLKKTTKFPIKFSSFYFGDDFLSYLETRDFGNSRVIVFSDYYLEDQINGGEILKRIKQKGINASVVIMSDTINRQTSIDTVKMGALCFLPKKKNTPFICSQMLSQMVNLIQN